MSSGVKINWSLYDNLIIQFLPNMTIADFTNTYLSHISHKAVGARAKKINIVPAKKQLDDLDKLKISNYFTKLITDEQRSFVINNANKMSRKDIAKQTNLTLHIIKRIFKESSIIVDDEFTKHIHNQKSKEHVHLATEASVAKFKNDKNHRDIIIKKISDNSKKLWKCEKYRSKVKDGISKKYANSDLRERLSEIGRDRYLNDKSVRDILHKPREFKNSKFNDKIADVLETNKIEFEREFELASYHFDFKIGNILLEAQGDYWHNLPSNIKNDRAKASIINTYYPEYELKYLWESEFKKIRGSDRLLELIDYKKPDTTAININELEFEIYNDNKSAEKFLNSYHYIGWTGRSTYMFRLCYCSQTVMIALFGHPIRPNTASGKVLELIRLCRNPYFYNKNMGSYFIRKCIQQIRLLVKYDNLVSFCDDSVHDGAIYKASNWAEIGKTQTDYQYVSENNVPMHKKTLYNRAKQANLTEREYAELHKFTKTKTGTKTKYVFSLV